MRNRKAPNDFDTICDLRVRKIKAVFFNQVDRLIEKKSINYMVVHCKVERIFGNIRCWFSGEIARYKGCHKMHTQNLLEGMTYVTQSRLNVLKTEKQRLKRAKNIKKRKRNSKFIQ